MRIIAQSLLLTTLLAGCMRSDPNFPGYKVGSGDLTHFLLESAISFGARPIRTNGLPTLAGDWRSRADKDGIQIYYLGDHFREVQSLLLEAFGPPAMAPTLNGERRFSGVVYAAPAIGAAINLGRENGDTEVVIVKQGALKP